jgi:hypothetical protein
MEVLKFYSRAGEMSTALCELARVIRKVNEGLPDCHCEPSSAKQSHSKRFFLAKVEIASAKKPRNDKTWNMSTYFANRPGELARQLSIIEL